MPERDHAVSRIDPILMSVFARTFRSITEEMSA
jgi:hypothetical protein